MLSPLLNRGDFYMLAAARLSRSLLRGSSSVPYVPSGGARQSTQDRRLLAYQHARDGAGPGPVPGRSPDRCEGWFDHPTAFVSQCKAPNAQPMRAPGLFGHYASPDT